MTSPSEQRIIDHYCHANLLQAVLDRVAPGHGRDPSVEGLTADTLTMEALATVDEFHTGGAGASDRLLARLPLSGDSRVLDAGCGIGGTVRRVARRFGCRVTGIDLTAAYIDVATHLTKHLRLQHLCTFHTGSVLDLPFDDAAFDVCLSLHVAMNISDRSAFYAEIHRVLATDGVFACYDLVSSAAVDRLTFPMPWSESCETSFLLSAEQTERSLVQAGFELVVSAAAPSRRPSTSEREPTDTERPANVLLGERAAEKVANHRQALQAGIITPHTFVVRKVV